MERHGVLGASCIEVEKRGPDQAAGLDSGKQHCEDCVSFFVEEVERMPR